MFFLLYLRRTKLKTFLSDSRRCECVLVFCVYVVALCCACGFPMCLYTTNKCFRYFFSSCLACVFVCVLEFYIHKTGFWSLVLLLLLQRKTFFSANNGKSFQHFEAVLCCNFKLFFRWFCFTLQPNPAQHQREQKYTDTNKQLCTNTHTTHLQTKGEKNTHAHTLIAWLFFACILLSHTIVTTNTSSSLRVSARAREYTTCICSGLVSSFQFGKRITQRINNEQPTLCTYSQNFENIILISILALFFFKYSINGF